MQFRRSFEIISVDKFFVVSHVSFFCSIRWNRRGNLSLKAHVSQLTAHCYSCLQCIKSCRHALTRITAATVVNSLIATRLDYCNSLLAGYTKQSW